MLEYSNQIFVEWRLVLGVPARYNFNEARALAVVGGLAACAVVYAFGTFVLGLGTLSFNWKELFHCEEGGKSD